MADAMTYRVLLVEDDFNIRITLAALLEMEGFVVVEAENGEDALRLACEESFDIVLTDVRLPGISGVRLAQKIKERSPGKPIMLMTAYSHDNGINQAIEEGVFAVLTKPFDATVAASLMSRAIARPSVLVIDDTETFATSMAESLKLLGISAVAVFDGQAALDLAQKGGIDVCLVDLVMPGLNGAEVIEKLRAIDPAIIIIAISGVSSPEAISDVMSKGARGFMAKPLDPAALMHSIARAHLASAPPPGE